MRRILSDLRATVEVSRQRSTGLVPRHEATHSQDVDCRPEERPKDLVRYFPLLVHHSISNAHIVLRGAGMFVDLVKYNLPPLIILTLPPEALRG